MDKQPTEAQKEEFWEGLGVEPYYVCAGGEKVYPDIDPNNLFKYAVPKVVIKITQIFKIDVKAAYKTLFDWWLAKMFHETLGTVEALFWAIWEVIHNGSSK